MTLKIREAHLVEGLLVWHLDPLEQLDGVLGALEARALDPQVVTQLLDAALDRVAGSDDGGAAAASATAADVVLALGRLTRRLLVVLK